jgi:hypothetical protein
MKNLDICFRKEKHRKLVYDIIRTAFHTVGSYKLKPLTCTEFIDCFLANKRFSTEKMELFNRQLNTLNNASKSFRFFFNKPEYNTNTCKLPYELKKCMYEFERKSFLISCTIVAGKYGQYVLRIDLEAKSNHIDIPADQIGNPPLDIYDELAF